MKKRLSLLLAVLMIVSLLPMSAFAAATPYFSVLQVTADETNPKKINVNFLMPKGTPLKEGKMRFELDNGAKFKPAANDVSVGAGQEVDISGGAAVAGSPADVKVNAVDNILFVEMVKDYPAKDNTTQISFRLNIDVLFPKEGEVKLKVVDETENAIVGLISQDHVIAKVAGEASKDMTITVKDAEKAVSYDGGSLSQFEIKNFDEVATNDVFKISPEDKGVRFTYDTKIFVDGSEIKKDADGNDTGNDGVADDAAQYLILSDGSIVLEKTAVTKDTKSIIVKPVVSVGNKVSEGDLSVEVASTYKDGDKEKNHASASAVIGKLVDYSVTLSVVEKGKKEIPSLWGGETATVKVTLKGPKGSILDRKINFAVEGADVVFSKDTKFEGSEEEKGNFKNGEFLYYETGMNTKDEISFELKIKVAHDKDGVATITASQRAWEAKADLAKVTPKFSVKTEEMPVKKGESRNTADLVITEAKAGLLKKGEKLTLKFNTRRDYTQFAAKGIKLEATNGMKFGDPSYSKDKTDNTTYYMIEVPITKASSKEPAVITVSDVKVLVDGSATDDSVKIQVGLDGNKVVEPNYIKVVKEYALESITTVFTIGQTQYTLNGQPKAAASAPYIKNGKTMLPIRAIAESLGLNVQWNGATKTATFADATKVAAVVIGADMMYVNGTPIKLGAKAELVNGTTFVELRSLANAFSVQIDWDAAAKTATVSK